ncbi:MAG: hypothetical protein GX639_15820 [Fibrobacter sp.]|nr:hypothetical protein [Fibrobacter sp.]
MNLRVILLGTAALLFAGCGAYKQLQPKPELSPAETASYIELKNGKNDFEIKKDKKYFIQFPSPQENNFYLVLSLPQKKTVSSSLTAVLTDKKQAGEPIKDESSSDTLSVYPVNQNSTGYFFLIDKIGQNKQFKVNYRYAPQWRYKFEGKYAEFQNILSKNRLDRKNYSAIGNGYHLDGLNYAATSDSLKKRSAELESMHKELLAIESIFPKSILNSKDVAYQNYLKLRADLEDELKFQENYLATIAFFSKEYFCRNNPSELVKSVDDFTGYFQKKERYPSTVISEAQTVIKGRLPEIVPFYAQRLSGKDDAKPFDENLYMTGNLYRTRLLYEAAGLSIPPEYNAIVKYVKDFDAKAIALANARDTITYITTTVNSHNQMPDNEFFRIAVAKTTTVQNGLPSTIDESYGKYTKYKSTAHINTELTAVSNEVTKLLGLYKQAELLVVQLNSLKEQRDYSTMLGMIKQNMHLTFLPEKYKILDKMSVEEQSSQIQSALESNNWVQAENLLRKLHEDINFLNAAEILPLKIAAVDSKEDQLYTRIDNASRVKITQFLDANVNTLEDVDSLYSDTIFTPVHNITFSSGSRSELVQRKNKLIEDLGKMRDDEFPARAIKTLYEQFTANPSDNGVLKARAIVTHGKHYKANDKKTKTRIAECDPYSAKWITKPKEYRRVFVLPVTNSKKGKNKYVVRYNVDIETEADFPMYDVNIKLPKEIASNAATSQWYESITLNKKPLKNEGRFTITAPSAENDYECQITPVQMNKDKGNILEITFYDNSFKVYTFSTMIQKPIIKKN